MTCGRHRHHEGGVLFVGVFAVAVGAAQSLPLPPQEFGLQPRAHAFRSATPPAWGERDERAVAGEHGVDGGALQADHDDDERRIRAADTA